MNDIIKSKEEPVQDISGTTPSTADESRASFGKAPGEGFQSKPIQTNQSMKKNSKVNSSQRRAAERKNERDDKANVSNHAVKNGLSGGMRFKFNKKSKLTYDQQKANFEAMLNPVQKANNNPQDFPNKWRQVAARNKRKDAKSATQRQCAFTGRQYIATNATQRLIEKRNQSIHHLRMENQTIRRELQSLKECINDLTKLLRGGKQQNLRKPTLNSTKSGESSSKKSRTSEVGTMSEMNSERFTTRQSLDPLKRTQSLQCLSYKDALLKHLNVKPKSITRTSSLKLNTKQERKHMMNSTEQSTSAMRNISSGSERNKQTKGCQKAESRGHQAQNVSTKRSRMTTRHSTDGTQVIKMESKGTAPETHLTDSGMQTEEVDNETRDTIVDDVRLINQGLSEEDSLPKPMIATKIANKGKESGNRFKRNLLKQREPVLQLPLGEIQEELISYLRIKAGFHAMDTMMIRRLFQHAETWADKYCKELSWQEKERLIADGVVTAMVPSEHMMVLRQKLKDSDVQSKLHKASDMAKGDLGKRNFFGKEISLPTASK
ncbi:hypothetical protein 1 [Hubei tombus-like virus 23]|uniref:hypothetical protein 1 n=1 Tax=Hubei tombus-like virus 23 TaxID=1923270 RepID=UPI0009096947|nr:hypothetical protein 1 [Hubei tombus-like virus 23]APG76536.1 hypothetical protein 1 [Hubei tombus-like virus 23]